MLTENEDGEKCRSEKQKSTPKRIPGKKAVKDATNEDPIEEGSSNHLYNRVRIFDEFSVRFASGHQFRVLGFR